VILGDPGQLLRSRYANFAVEGVNSMLDIRSYTSDLEELIGE
jgi:hypothetical protein